MLRLLQSKNWHAIAIGCLLILLLLCRGAWGIYSQVLPQIDTLRKIDDSTPFTTFDDPTLDFVMGYPKPWDASHLAYGLQGDGTAKATITGLGNTVYIRAVSYPSAVTLNQVMTDRQRNWRKSIYSGDTFTLTTLSESQTIIDSTPALLAEYETQTMGNTILDVIFGPSHAHGLESYFVHNGKAFILSFDSNVTTYYPNYADYVNIYHRMIQSIRFR